MADAVAVVYRVLHEVCSIFFDSGTLLNKYQLHRRVGGGHFGEVWLARDTYLS